MNGEHWKQTGLGAIIYAVLTTLGVVGSFQVLPVIDDRFRGQDANLLRQEMEAKIQHEAKSVNQEFLVISQRLEQIVLVQSEIWRTIAALPPPEVDEKLEKIEDRLRLLEIEAAKPHIHPE